MSNTNTYTKSTAETVKKIDRIFGYARVSTPDQNLDMQIQSLEAAGCTRIWSEKKSAQARRIEFEKMLLHCRPGDTIVIWKLDRLARSVQDLLKWNEQFQERGIHLRVLNPPVNTNDALGKAFFTLTAVFAQLERDLVAERTKAGMAAAKANGRTFGRPTKIVGDKRAAIERDIRDLSLTMKQVAERHGYKSLTTLNRHFPGLRQQVLIDAGVRKPKE